MQSQRIMIIGAGLVGSLLAALLAQRGFDVEVFERRPDPRVHGFLGGRSINLALAERGLHALRHADIADDVLADAVMMRGRMVHAIDGTSNLQRYGRDDSEVIWSVSRGGLNILLIDAAQRAGAKIHFDAPLLDAQFDAPASGGSRITLGDAHGGKRTLQSGLLLGADGAGSALRAAMAKETDLGERVEPLGHGYRELEIPPACAPSLALDGFAVPSAGSRPFPGRGDVPAVGMTDHAPAREQFAIEPNALHIWPRGGYMCIALPNAQANFTVTLFLPNDAPHPSFVTLPDAQTAELFFREQFPDALALMPDFARDWDAHPVGQLATLYLDRWHIAGRALLLGDAAHAIAPFHGQGMNAGFEDAVELAHLIDAQFDDPSAVFVEFQRTRKPNSDAIAAMALENYVEMRDGVADPHYLLKRELAFALAERAPEHFMPRYRMVTFTRMPYAFCLQRGREQTALLESLLAGCTQVEQVDLEAAATRVRNELPPLPLDN